MVHKEREPFGHQWAPQGLTRRSQSSLSTKASPSPAYTPVEVHSWGLSGFVPKVLLAENTYVFRGVSVPMGASATTKPGIGSI